jgi:hypothetical protein
MPEKATLKRARAHMRRGDAPSTAAGEFVREEIEHIRHGKHGARSTKQAIAIGLSKARRAGIPMGTPKNARASLKRQAKRESAQAKHPHKPEPRRSRAMKKALKREPHRIVSKTALSRHAKRTAAAALRTRRANEAKRAHRATASRKRTSKRSHSARSTSPRRSTNRTRSTSRRANAHARRRTKRASR